MRRDGGGCGGDCGATGGGGERLGEVAAVRQRDDDGAAVRSAARVLEDGATAARNHGKGRGGGCAGDGERAEPGGAGESAGGGQRACRHRGRPSEDVERRGARRLFHEPPVTAGRSVCECPRGCPERSVETCVQPRASPCVFLPERSKTDRFVRFAPRLKSGRQPAVAGSVGSWGPDRPRTGGRAFRLIDLAP